MYIPNAFLQTDKATVLEVLDKYGFGIVVSNSEGELLATHIPLLFKAVQGQDYLYGHMARNNDQWKSFSPDQKIMVIFSGPHGYISPTWYESKLTVPTWDHISVHVYGYPELIPDLGQVKDLLTQTTDHYEKYNGTQWKFELPEEFSQKLMGTIVAFRLKVVDIQAQFKLSQNRNAEDKAKVIRALNERGDASSVQLADLIKNFDPRKKG
jgi:transcriptional regulator